MLGKLFVSEIKQTYKPVVIIAVVLIGSTLVSNLENSLFMKLNVSRDNVFFYIFSTLLGLVFIGSMIALAVAGFISLCGNFYKSMYLGRGYLTHTLPVSTGKIFIVKLIVATIWMLISTVLIVGCFLFRATNITEENLAEFFGRIGQILQSEGVNPAQLVFIGKSPVATIAILLALAIMGIVGSFLFFFTAMTIGQLSAEHKNACSVGAGIGLYVIQQIAGIIIMLIIFPEALKHVTKLTDVVAIINKVTITTVIVYVVFLIAEYIVDMYIVKKRLNLQ